MTEIQQSRDICIKKLTSTSGTDLEITANITSSGQVTAVLQGYVAAKLNSRYGIEQYQVLLRLTDSWRGRCRDDLTGIGKTQDQFGAWNMGGGDE